MKNRAFPSLTIPRVPRWVRDAIRIEARRSQRTPADVLAWCVRAAMDPVVVKIAEARADAKLAIESSDAYRTHRELLAYLRQPLAAPASRRERLRAAAWEGDGPAPADPGTGAAPAQFEEESERRGHFAPIRLAPDSDT